MAFVSFHLGVRRQNVLSHGRYIADAAGHAEPAEQVKPEVIRDAEDYVSEAFSWAEWGKQVRSSAVPLSLSEPPSPQPAAPPDPAPSPASAAA
jgi:hypothetical protein